MELFGTFTAGSYVLRNDFVAAHPDAAQTFVRGVGRALDWSRTTPREAVIERFRAIIAKRKRNEDATVIKFWHSYGVGTPQGRIHAQDFGICVDWMVRAGELRRGQLNLPAVFTNELNQPQGI